MAFICPYASPLGDITLASDGEALIGLWFNGQKYFAAGLDEEREERGLSVFSETARWLDLYFAGEEPTITPALAPQGTPFCRAVWEALLAIPYGRTATYGELAERLGGTSARAVGSAVSRNPISILIPCHRVLGANGALTGYAGGVERKARLLALEAGQKPAYCSALDFCAEKR